MSFGNDVSPLATITIDQGTGDAILKEIYSDDGVQDEFYRDNPFLALMDKKEDVGGRYHEHAIWAGTGQAISRTFGGSAAGQQLQTAAANSGEQPYTFLIAKTSNYAVANISAEAIDATSSSKGAFVDMVRAIADNQLQQLVNDTAFGLFRGSDCSRAQVGGSVSGTTLTLQNTADGVNLELGMFLDFAASNTGSTVRALASNNTACQITAADVDAGVFTVKWLGSGTQTLTANNVAVGDYVYRSGDKSKGFNGFTDWIPYGALSSSDSFAGGVNRSAQRQRLAGSYMDGTGGQLEDILEKAVNKVSRIGGNINKFVMPYGQYTALANSQGAKVQLVNVKGESDIGFEGIEVTGVKGRVVCLPDRSCPSNLIAGVNTGSWTLISKGKAVHAWQEDGKIWLRSYNQFGMEIRFFSNANLVCKRPIDNINIQVNSLAV